MQFSLGINLHRSIPECTQSSSLTLRGISLSALAFLLSGFASPARAAELKAGFAQIDISTRALIPMGGYGTFFLKTPRLNGVGIHDPLLASAVFLESEEGDLAALVSVDAVGLSGTQVSRIEAKLRETLDPKIHLMISATHTHHSPDTLGLWGALPRSGRNARYGEQIETAIIQAVRDAYATRTEVKVSQRTGRHQNNSTHAPSPDDVQDQFISLSFHSAKDGNLLGTLTQWAAHPTVLGLENNALSADFVGAFRATMSSSSNATHVYFNGAIGKVYSQVPAADDPQLVEDLFPAGDKDPDVKDNYRRVSTVGFRLAQAVLKTPQEPLDLFDASSMNTCHVPVSFPVDNKLFKLASQLRVVETRIKSGNIRSRISSLLIGPLAFVTIPGELFPKLLRKLPAQSLAGRQPVWLGMGQDWLGYFVDPTDYQNSELKYWTDLSVHRDASKILLDGMSNALQNKGCVEWTDEE